MDGDFPRPFLFFDGRREELRAALSPYGIPVALPTFERLPRPVCGHSDLLVFPDGDRLYTYKEYFEAHPEPFTEIDVCPLPLPAGDYPDDLWLDCLFYAGRLIGREDRMPRELAAKYTPFGVKQGYARCGTLLFGDAAVTSDRGLAEALSSLGAEVLRIEPGHILLDGYGSGGFIGGASAVVGRKILFFGRLSSHPQGGEIAEFLSRAGGETVELFDAPLADFGGAAVLPREENTVL